ncbi:uncharacterized protein LOC100369208 [Saccoglossus kowalevskii]|uniref:glutathione gamma-glutamylcysteinyltransferase n=1 Tax=Saccoglossus kowalevskii TaxID=10224 RepID=A0ABM0GI75_SACKO|nr:PREDICTED: glutathione gamma-glutamylcysteinyltransferase 3-like [Saccoglossus kowalevskii]
MAVKYVGRFCKQAIISRAATFSRHFKMSASTPALIALNCDDGKELLKTSTYRQDDIIKYFGKQKHRTMCGLQTAAIVMNAMKLNSDSLYREETMFDLQPTLSVLDKSKVETRGCTLQEKSDLYRAFNLDVETYHASDSSEEEFRQIVKKTLVQSNCESTMVINYHMDVLGQGVPVGHISPLAAYHQGSDRILLMDVWPDTYELWAPTKDLFNAMNTINTVDNKSRGYIVVKQKKKL